MTPDDPTTRTRLPSNRAFIVHLFDRGHSDGDLPGRVEHVITGRSAHFNDLAALATFLRETLTPPDE